MKKLLCLVVVIVCLTGCSVNQDFVKTCNESWRVIGPEYIEYVQEDDELTEHTKALRIRTAELFTRLLKEAQDAE